MIGSLAVKALLIAAAGLLTISAFHGVKAAPALQTPAATLTGTITEAVTETNIRDGGRTIILTLTDSQWAIMALFLAERQNIINGITSAQNEANGWNNAVKPAIPVDNVVRTSDTVVTITLPAVAAYDITANETVTATIPASATDAGGPISAEPPFTVTAEDGEPTPTPTPASTPAPTPTPTSSGDINGLSRFLHQLAVAGVALSMLVIPLGAVAAIAVIFRNANSDVSAALTSPSFLLQTTLLLVAMAFGMILLATAFQDLMK